MSEKVLTLTLPEGYIQAVQRRHHGRILPEEVRMKAVEKMEHLYLAWTKAMKKYNALDDWWERREVEKHYKSRLWYYAHSKLKKTERAVRELHREMFIHLLSCDGNSERFDPHWCISAEEIYADFMSKYKK